MLSRNESDTERPVWEEQRVVQLAHVLLVGGRLVAVLQGEALQQPPQHHVQILLRKPATTPWNSVDYRDIWINLCI